MGGIFGVISHQPCVTDLFYGTDYHSHLGTKRGGMVVYNGNGVFARDIHSIESSYFRIKFEGDLHKYTGNSGLGIISDTDSQPILMNTHLGKFAVVTVGKLNNLKELEKELLAEGRTLSEMSSGKTNPSELIASIIASSDSFENGIKEVHRRIKGSCTFCLLTEHGIIAARDLYGRTPLILGKKEGTMAVCMETCSFANLGYEQEYSLGPGEAVMITADGFETIIQPGKKMQICSFLWVYYGYPVSFYEGVNVDDVRYELGNMLGKEDYSDIEIAAAIPDSGTSMAIGFAQGKGIPYRQAIVKYTPTWPRSFTPTTQIVRNLVAKMKLIPNTDIIREKKIAFCDDSIVRGTQLKGNATQLRNYGVKEIHVRISCPPLLFPCEFLNFSESNTPLELIARRFVQLKEGAHDRNLGKYVRDTTQEHKALVEYIRKELNLSSLKFTTIDHLVKAIGLPKECICTHCFDGSSYGF